MRPISTRRNCAKRAMSPSIDRLLIRGADVVVTMDQSKTVIATFEDPPPPSYLVTIGKTGIGEGEVLSEPDGIECAPDCADLYPAGTEVNLQAVPDYASTFDGWGGDGCTERDGAECRLSVDSNKALEAIFDLKPIGGVWAKKRRAGLNRVPRKGLMNAVTGICKLGSCKIEEVDARVVIKRRKYGSIGSSWSGSLFQAGQTRVVKVKFPGRLRKKLRARKSGTLVVSIGLTAADGRRAVTREIKIGIRR